MVRVPIRSRVARSIQLKEEERKNWERKRGRATKKDWVRDLTETKNDHVRGSLPMGPAPAAGKARRGKGRATCDG